MCVKITSDGWKKLRTCPKITSQTSTKDRFIYRCECTPLPIHIYMFLMLAVFVSFLPTFSLGLHAKWFYSLVNVYCGLVRSLFFLLTDKNYEIDDEELKKKNRNSEERKNSHQTILSTVQFNRRKQKVLIKQRNKQSPCQVSSFKRIIIYVFKFRT